MESSQSKVFIIGGRRGLGGHIKDVWKQVRPEDIVVTSSRLESATYICDLAREDDVQNLLHILDSEKPDRVFCIAGGGPYGAFSQKEWKDHSWSLSVTLLSPMRIAHHVLRSLYCQQLILVGSSVAENSADTYAASYCAGKHGLKGFVSTVVTENTGKDLRLFSPGYMSTDMLPANAAEKRGINARDPHSVAKEFVDWALSPKAAWHKTYTP